MADEPPTLEGVAGEEEEVATVPVTVLTGTLGAGKTTLLNYILTQHHGHRIAVIQNEFGEELGVENEMVIGRSDGTLFEECFELSNGCICCSIRDSLVATLEKIMQRRDKFDYVLVETTGLANPGPVASSFWLDEGLCSALYLDAIVTVADAHNLHRHVMGAENSLTEPIKQLAMADVILLNKVDLVQEPALTSLQQEIRKINALAPIHRTTKSQLDLSSILNIRAFNWAAHPDLSGASGGAPAKAEGGHGHSGVRTVLVKTATPLDLDATMRFIGELLWTDGGADRILRLKGVLSIAGDDRLHVLQGVHELFDIVPSRPWGADEARETKMVFIGFGLDAAKLESDVAQHCVPKAPTSA